MSHFQTRESGYSLLEVIGTVAILAIIMLAVATLNNNMMTAAIRESSLAEVDQFRRKLVRAIMNDGGWRRSMTDTTRNGSMQCLRAPNMSCGAMTFNPGANPPLAIYNQAGMDDETYNAAGGPKPGPVYDATDPTNGITLLGKKCRGFSATAATPQCPLRFDLRWYTLSDSASPAVAVYAALQITPGLQLPIDPNNYSIGFFANGSLQNPLVRAAQ